MLSGYIDDELDPDEKQELESHLKECDECRKELKAFNKLKEVTGAMKYADIPEHVWDKYWKSMYRKFELGIGWILLSIGVVIMLGYVCYQMVEDFFMNPAEPLLLKIGIAALVIGFLILLVSVLRERIFAYKRDRYSEVKR
jgi:hypothetical protein